MLNLRKSFIVLAMVVTLGAGCAQKQATSESSPIEGASGSMEYTEIERAAQDISQGIVYFEFDKFDIQSQYNEMLRQKAELLKNNPSIRIRIEGNCDARGTEEYNLALGGKRAMAAYDYLIRLGVNPAQMETVSYGKERPAVLGTGADVWSKNRRDDFQIIGR